MRPSLRGVRPFRLLAVLATIASLGVVAIEPTLRREAPARFGRLVATPVSPLTDAPERSQSEEEPLSGPTDEGLPESIKIARWESLPRRGAAIHPGGSGRLPTVPVRSLVGGFRGPRADSAHADRTPLCTRLCRLTC